MFSHLISISTSNGRNFNQKKSSVVFHFPDEQKNHVNKWKSIKFI
jgi:hypothetical protein